MTPSARPLAETRLLMLPPTSRDAAAMEQVLCGDGIHCALEQNLSALCSDLAEGAGALVLSEESLLAQPEPLIAFLQSQPVWSDLPIIVLCKSIGESPALAAILARLGDVTVLERPIRVSTLISSAKTALRARERQYQIRDHLAELAKARGEAERVSRMKDEFLATVSHELRTPLNAILGWAHILKVSGTVPPTIAEGLTVIDRNARAQAKIIEDLLDMSRIISGKVALTVEQIELADVVRAAIDTARPAADAKGVNLHIKFDAAASSISGDRNRLQQVFWNLISNAVKFTPRSGRIQVTLGRSHSQLQVTVADSGEGIDGAFLPYVFDRFRQADASTTRRHGGLGLGLSIVKQLVELHGGSVRVDSDGLGHGATFGVLLPLAALQVEADPVPAKGPLSARFESAPVVEADIAGVRVLVVDDEADARALMRRLLEDRNAVVRAADSVAAALDLLAEELPDVLVSDIGMPEQDGYALIRQVRELTRAANRRLPAIALTAYAREEDRVKALATGYQRQLVKPVDPAELIATISMLASAQSRAAVE